MTRSQQDIFGQEKKYSLVRNDQELKDFWQNGKNGIFIYPTPAPNAILRLDLYVYVCSCVFKLNIKQMEARTTEKIEVIYQNPVLSPEEKKEFANKLLKKTVTEAKQHSKKIVKCLEKISKNHKFWNLCQ